MIQFRDVSKHYDNQTALRKITFFVDRGEMVFITGPSGSGKTTLLKMVYMAVKPDEGDITVADMELMKLTESSIPALRRNIGVVFQDFRLLDNRDVFENIAIALRIRNIDEKGIKALVKSREYVRGKWWQTCWRLFVTSLITLLPTSRMSCLAPLAIRTAVAPRPEAEALNVTLRSV